MKGTFTAVTFLLFLFLPAFLYAQITTSSQWTWVKGDSIKNAPGVYGTQGVAATANKPGARFESVSWKDAADNFWLFSGSGVNDLWKYNPATNQWAWMNGNNTGSQQGVYGTMGVAAATNKPGARQGSVSWTDAAGNFWLFGGYGYAVSGFGVLNDLWKYNPATNQWTWMSGDNSPNQPGVYGTMGTTVTTNKPGARQGSVSWRDAAGNLWLLGGNSIAPFTAGAGLLNDLWRYNPATNQWTWMSGANTTEQIGTFGTRGVAAVNNKPGARQGSISWTDAVGNLWLFGGEGYTTVRSYYLNDLWKYNPASNQWAWMNGSNANDQTATYGTKGVAATTNNPGGRYKSVSWADATGNLWLFGGLTGINGFGTLNDLWKYNPSTDQWTWMNGDNIINQPGVYGIMGTAAGTNKPGSRQQSTAWIDAGDNLWLFGGSAVNGGSAPFNDLWKLGNTVALPSQPNLSINDVSNSEGNSGTTTYSFTVSLSSPAPTGGVTFNIATANGTATAGSDYVAKSLTAQTIPAGSSTYTFDVQVNGDVIFESDETFFVNVSNVTGAVIMDGQGLGTITNDECSPITITPATLPNTTQGTSYIQTIGITGGSGSYTTTLSGNVPTGLNLSGNTLSGVPTATGTYNFTVTATDATGCTTAASKAYTIVVNPVIPGALVATSIVFTEESFSNQNGYLDPGETGNLIITLNNPSAVTVTNVGASLTTSTPGIGIWGASAVYGSITPGSSVVGNRLVIGANASVACGTVINFTLTLYLTGGTSPQTIPFTLKVGNQPLKNGITTTLDATAPPANTYYTSATGMQTGRIVQTGIPSTCILLKAAPGLNDNTLRKYDAYTLTNTTSTSQCVTVALSTTAGSNLLYSAAYNSAGFVPSNPNTNFLADAGSSNFSTTYSFNVAAGAAFTVVVHDAGATASNAQYTLSIDLSYCVPGPVCRPYIFTPDTLASATLGVPYSQSFNYSGGSGYSSTINNLVLPPGLSNSASFSTISGTPTQVGSYTFAINVTDPTCTGVTKNYTIVVKPATQPNLTVNDVSRNEGNSSVNIYTFTVSLSAPAPVGGVTFNIATDNGTATAGSDYVAKSLTAQTIPAGSTTYTFDVLVNGDILFEPDETFFVNVSNVTGATVSDGQGIGTITNDDAVSAAQTISFPAISDKTYGDAAFRLAATASSGLPVTYRVVSGPVSISGDTVFINGAGNAVIEAMQPGNLTYQAAPPVTKSFIINKAAATITLSNLNRVYDGSPKIPGAITNPTGLPVTYLFNGASAPPVNAGTYYVAATISNANYTGTASDTLRIAKANQQITLIATPDKEYSTPPFTILTTSSSNLPVVLSIQANPVNCAILSGNIITVNEIGTVIINASQPGNTNYNAALGIADTFNITKANQQVTIAPIPEVTIDSVSVTVNATVSSGLPLSYSIITNPTSGVASLSGNVITLSGDTGTVVVKVLQAGNQFFNAAEAQRTFKVLGRNQYITFSSISNKTFGEAPFTLQATASSALPVQYTIVSGAAFFSGNVLTVTGAGTITVQASQPGNNSIRAATPVRQTFSVSKAAQSIATDTITDKTYGDAPFTLTAQATSGLPVHFTIQSGYAYMSGNNIIITGAGMVTVKAIQNGNQNYLPAATAQQTFCVAPKKPQKIYGFVQSCISTQPYSIDTIAGATYTWTVSGGGTLLTNSGSKINVSWNSTGIQELFVKVNNECNPAANDTIGIKVQVINLPVPPDVTNLFPVNSTVITDFPLSLSWQASGLSQVYDLFVWPEGSVQPATPYAANLQTVAAVIYNGSQLPGFAPGAKYNWRVVTKNACRQSGGVTGNFIISKLPNLVLQSVQAADTVFSGKKIDVSVKVLNNGGASTRNTRWTDAVYLSRDTVLNTQFDTYIGGAGNLSSLDSGMQYIHTLHCTLPQNTIGNYHLIVVTNAYNSLTESTRQDDTIKRPLLINLTPPPDLQVTVVATPHETFSAQFIPVTYTVKNKGAGQVSNSKWMDYIYISPDPVFDRITAVKIGEKEYNRATNLVPLLPDSSYTNTVSLLLPARFVGTYYIFVETDVKDSIYEFTFENNNTNRNDSLQIFLTPPPDFIVTQANIPANISSQEIVKVDYTVKNLGATSPQESERKWMDGIYISGDSVFDIRKARLLDYTIPYTRTYSDFCPVLISGGGGSGGGGASGGGGSPLGGIGLPYIPPQNYCNTQSSINIKYYNKTLITSTQDTIFYLHYPCSHFSWHPFMVHDESYGNQISAALPDSLEGIYYLHVRTDFTNTVFEFQQENNNSKATKVQLLNPDLVVSNLSMADTASSGTNMPLTWIVKNGGHGKVFDKNRKDLIWLSASPVYNPAGMIRVDSLIYCTAMDTGATITKQKIIRIPDGLSGNYYLFVETDKDKAIYEGNHETNNYLSNPVTIKLSPWPDLKMNIVQLSRDSAEFDEDFILSYNVSNVGIAAITGKTWKDLIYVSRSPVSDMALGYKATEIFRAQSLDTMASYTINQPMRIDGGIINAIGVDSNYYVHVFTDGNKEIYEHNTENNNFGSKKLYVKNMDLAVTTVNGALNVFSGQNASVSWQVFNKGGKSDIHTRWWYDKVYLSVDTVLDAGDAAVTTEYINGPILSNSTYTRTINYQVPHGYSGNYYLLVSSDDDYRTRDVNRVNNMNTIRHLNGTPKPISVTLTPSPDLIVTALDVPSIGYTGQPITIKWQIKNTGVGPTLTGGWKEQVYLTTSPNPQSNNSVNGTLIGTYTRTGNLAIDSTYTDSMRVFVPAILNGNYYLYFVTDFPSQVYEHHAETNNGALRQIFIIRPQPSDLVVSNIVHPLQALAGDTFTVSWKVKNMGINPAEGYFTQGVYLSKDTAWSVDDALVSNTEATIYISPSDEKLFSKNIRTRGAIDGSYFVIVRTDLTNNIVETDDNNNTGISTDSMSVSVLNLPLSVVTPHPLLSKTELYYKLNIPDSLEGETVLISLRSYLPLTPNEMYVRFGDMPSRSTFEYGFQNANSGNQDIIIPAASKGNYYILIYNNSDSSQYNISLLAQKISFSIISVRTNEGGNTGLVTVKIGGAKFEPGMQVSLQSNTLGTIVANSVQYVNSTTVFATFNLAGRGIGLYNLVAKKGTNDLASLPDGFRIIQGSGGGFQGGSTTTGGFYCTIQNIGVDELVGFDIESPALVRLGQYFSMNINFGNAGNVDVPLPGRLLASINGAPISLTQEGLADGKRELYLEFKEQNGPEGVLRPGATGSITIYTRGTIVGNQAVVNQVYRLIE